MVSSPASCRIRSIRSIERTHSCCPINWKFEFEFAKFTRGFTNTIFYKSAMMTKVVCSQIPAALMNWHSPIGDDSWWSIQELSKLDLSHNEFKGCLSEPLFVTLSELTVNIGR